MELNSWSERDQLTIIDIWMKSRCLKVNQTKNPCTSEIWYHSSISCNTENYGKFKLSHSRLFENDHMIFLYVVSVRHFAKLWDNEFSWNQDRTYLLHVMLFFSVQDHTQGPCATWDICQKRILNSNQARSRLPIAYFILTQSFGNVVHCTAVILTWSVQNIKNMWRLKGMLWTNEILRVLSLRWVSGGYPPTLDSPIGDNFFQLYRATLGAVEQLS